MSFDWEMNTDFLILDSVDKFLPTDRKKDADLNLKMARWNKAISNVNQLIKYKSLVSQFNVSKGGF